MTAKEIRPEQKLTVLKHLAAGKSREVVATITHLSIDQVVEVGRSHGYPDRDKLAWAADVVEKNIADEAAAKLPGATPGADVAARAARAQAAARPAASSQTPTPAPRPTVVPSPPEPASKPDEFRVLINTAKNHDRKNIQRLAEKILDDCARLRGLIDQEAAAHAERQRVKNEREQAKAEVARLAEELAAARAKLRGSTKATPAEIRAWARKNGLDAPERGRLSDELRQAYATAHQQVAS